MKSKLKGKIMLHIMKCFTIGMYLGCGVVDFPDHVKIKKKVKQQPKYSMLDHDITFDPYISGFPNRKKKIPMVFVDDMEKAGVCYSWSYGHSEIEINKKSWEKYSVLQRRWLMWHELGHCELNKAHNEAHVSAQGKTCVDDDHTRKCGAYIPVSVMRWYIPLDWQIRAMCKLEKIGKLSRLFCDNLSKE